MSANEPDTVLDTLARIAAWDGDPSDTNSALKLVDMAKRALEANRPTFDFDDETHPMQAIISDGKGVARFKPNKIVRYLLDACKARGVTDLNDLGAMPFENEDWTQFIQLLGYSVSGAGDLDFFDRDVLAEADEIVEAMIEAGKL